MTGRVTLKLLASVDGLIAGQVVNTDIEQAIGWLKAGAAELVDGALPAIRDREAQTAALEPPETAMLSRPRRRRAAAVKARD